VTGPSPITKEKAVYTAPQWFTAELQPVIPGGYARYFSRYKKFMIVRDYFKRIPGMTEYVPEIGRHVIVEEVLEDKKHRPIHPVNWAKLLKALRLMRYSRVNIKLEDALRVIDEREEKRVWDCELENQQRAIDFHKQVRKLETAKTFS